MKAQIAPHVPHSSRIHTREELLETLRITLAEALEFNPQEARGAAGSDYEELQIAV